MSMHLQDYTNNIYLQLIHPVLSASAIHIAMRTIRSLSTVDPVARLTLSEDCQKAMITTMAHSLSLLVLFVSPPLEIAPVPQIKTASSQSFALLTNRVLPFGFIDEVRHADVIEFGSKWFRMSVWVMMSERVNQLWFGPMLVLLVCYLTRHNSTWPATNE